MRFALDEDSQTALVAAVHAGCLDVVAFLGAEPGNMHYKVQWAAQHGHLQASSSGMWTAASGSTRKAALSARMYGCITTHFLCTELSHKPWVNSQH